MKEKYARWIAENVSDPKLKCRETTEAMVQAFPELKRVRGHYATILQGERPHWWCVDPEDGSIVDPTAAQFGVTYPEDYYPLDESLPEPTGKCLNCGGLVYDGSYHCSPECDQQTRHDYGFR